MTKRQRVPKAISGRWEAIEAIQSAVDKQMSMPKHLGRLDSIDIRLYDYPTAWELREWRPSREKMELLAAERGHKIVGAGGFGAEGKQQPMFGYFLLTERDRETYLSVLNLDAGDFESWRVHHIPGKTRQDDLLFIEFGDDGRQRQGGAFGFRESFHK